ncbi:MAG: hypothetical protein FIB00_10965 [Chloroflexi bacterium]|nr:hypothetical protein [Chloroflexota bacterium]
MGGLRAIAGSALIAAACLLVACEDAEPAAHGARPETVEEFFAELEQAIQKDGKVFHATVELRAVDNGVEGLWATTEGWVQDGAERARAHWQKGPGNTNDIAERTVHIYDPDGVYSANLDGDDDPGFRRRTEAENCLADAPTPIVAQVACGFLPFGGPDWQLSVEQSKFEGRATVALVGTYAVSSPVGSEEFPVGGPTPHPVMTAATRAVYTLHLDAASHLPVASGAGVDSDPDRKVFGSEARFQTEFLDDSSLPNDWFDPRSIGYVPPAEQERRVLEDPKLGTPVYWLGRSFDPQNGLPPLGSLYVNGYQPGRQRGGDEPNIQIGLRSSGRGGMVRLDHYPPGDWEAFKQRLGGNFPWTWCSEMREFTVGAAKVTILAGYESFPYDLDPGAVTVVPVTPGHDPPPVQGTLTVPPLKTEPCPATPPDRFMAEVRFPDATVVINGPLGYGGQDGRPWGAYDTAEALEVVARALRPRQQGE